MYIDKHDEYNSTYHRIIKMNPVDVMSGIYIDFDIEYDDKDPKFKVGYHVRISKYKTILRKATLQIGPKRYLWPKKLRILCHGHMLFVISRVKKS